jgi:nuclear transport factor 2 (NTF2) superfamily protein
METFTSTGTATGLWVPPLSGGGTSIGTTYLSSTTFPSIPNNTVSFSNAINFTQATSKQIMQNKVAVFKVTRDKDEKITNAEFIKELWVETKNGQSVDFQVARDKDLADYEMSDLSIRTIYTVTF